MVATERGTQPEWASLAAPVASARRTRTKGHRFRSRVYASARSCVVADAPRAHALAPSGALDVVRQVGFLVVLLAFGLATMVGVSGLVLQVALGH